MREIFIALSLFLFAQNVSTQGSEDEKIKLIKKITKEIENLCSSEEQLEKAEKQKELMEPEKSRGELEKIQKITIEIQRGLQRLTKQALRFKGDTEISKDDFIDRDVIVQDGNLVIYGKITGDILVENGDVILKDQAEVNGNIYTTNGEIKISKKAKFTGEKYENISFLAEADKLISYNRRKHRHEVQYNRFYEANPGIDNFYFEFERVSGFKIGLILPRKFLNIIEKPISAYGYGAYATKSHRWLFSIGIDKALMQINENLFLILGAQVYSTVGTKDNWLVSPNANTISTLLWNNDYRDYFKQEGFNIYIELSLLSMTSNFRLTYSADSYKSEAAKYIKYFNWNKKRPFRENPPVYDGRLKTISLSYKLKSFQLIEGFRRSGVGIQLNFEKELENFRYTSLIVELKARLSLSDYDNLGLRLRIGSSDKILPKQKSFEIGGFNTLYAFPYKAFEGNRILLVNLEYILKNPIDIFELVNLFIFCDAGYANNEEGGIISGFRIRDMNEIKSDFGFGFGTESMKTRIYFAWRTDKKMPPNIVLTLSSPF